MAMTLVADPCRASSYCEIEARGQPGRSVMPEGAQMVSLPKSKGYGHAPHGESIAGHEHRGGIAKQAG